MLTVLAIVLGVLVMGCGGVLWRAARNEARAEAQWPPEGQFIEVDGLQVHAVVMGQGPDLVLIHGTGGNSRDMTLSLAPRLADRYRVIVFDRPGLGYTDAPKTGTPIAVQARILSEAARRLGADRPIVLGQSYGGAVALAWAAYLPDRLSALVAVAAPSNPWSFDLPTLYKVTSHPVGKAIVVPLMTAFVPQAYVARTIAGIFAPQSAPKGYGENVGPGLTLRRASLRATGDQRRSLLREVTEMVQHYKAISVPVEIVHGDADTTVAPWIHSEKLVTQIDGAAYDILPGIGHMPHHVAEDAVIAAIDRAAERAASQAHLR
ncbi:MAG: alpha/beta hydrolase [Rhodobacteraceae bacterium]|nr:alpha/beta hydrolase [Paracoccaceae bacterium]MAY45716.1 alpha/beta hydrolase [Paracoccaceae bacterium]